MFLAYSAVVARSFAAAFDKYDPDLIISVHPLMQHVPVRCVLAGALLAAGSDALCFTAARAGASRQGERAQGASVRHGGD
jgi:hypothetical protein